MPLLAARWRRAAFSSRSRITGSSRRCAIRLSLRTTLRRCAGSWAMRRLWGRSSRLVLMGHSAGAYNAAMLALDPRWLGDDRRAVRGLIGLAGPYDFLPFSGKVERAAFAGVVDPRSTQPVNVAGPGDPPAFLATGDEDKLVRPRNSDALVKSQAAGRGCGGRSPALSRHRPRWTHYRDREAASRSRVGVGRSGRVRHASFQEITAAMSAS